MERLNVVGIETSRGYRVMELYRADLTSGAVAADVLVVSAFQGDYTDVPGTLLASLKAELNIDLDHESRHAALDLRSALGCWVSREVEGALPFDRILVVEIPWNVRATAPTEAGGVNESINHVFVTLAVLEAKGIPIASVAMPVLGTGSQRLPSGDIVAALLREGEKALQRQQYLERISFVERNPDRAAELSEAMDKQLGRAAITLPKSELIESLKHEVAMAVSNLAADLPPGHSRLSQELHHFAANPTRSFHEVGLVARWVVEYVVSDLLPNSKSNTNLLSRIDSLGSIGVTPWVRGYMHTLRHLGNEAAHSSDTSKLIPPHAAKEDLAIALFCVLRVISFWREYRASEVTVVESANEPQNPT